LIGRCSVLSVSDGPLRVTRPGVRTFDDPVCPESLIPFAVRPERDAKWDPTRG
jgi:hypothetical protein